MRTAIVSAADAAFFELLTNLLDSIDRHKPDTSLEICILDVGLTAAQRQSLENRVTRVCTPGWDFEFPGRESLPRWFQTLVTRPFFPRHFPEYDRYLFLDADTWLQDWRAIDLLLAASADGKLAIVPEIHQAYADTFRQRPQITQNIRDHYRMLFDQPMADHMASLPVINAGVWALVRVSPAWNVWSEALQWAYGRNSHFLTDQCALNAALFTGKIPFHPRAIAFSLILTNAGFRAIPMVAFKRRSLMKGARDGGGDFEALQRVA